GLGVLLAGQVMAAEVRDYPADKVGAHTWVIHGPIGLPSVENQGFMNNPSFTVTDKSVVVMDPGSSRQAGEMVLRQIRKLTDKPVTHVFNSHVHGDHWLGNQAFKQAYPKAKFYAHPEMIKMAHEGEAESWLKAMLSMTEGATKGTEAVIPTQVLKNAQKIEVDNLTFEVYLSEHAHTKTDAMIKVVQDGLLVTGDNILNQRIGRMDDASFRGNIAACETAKNSGATLFVPGHGPSGDAASTLTFCDYLSNLYTQVGEQVEEGLSAFEIKPLLLPQFQAFANWPGFEEEFGKQISLAALEYEQAAFE
ncbi:MAG: MBL fold metallo-hydrolase, partial [Gammaproteobacteria bacterium]|nr:MBL fold metallo-hydrolase [Gammaproteobacteria bacterium]